MMSLNVDEFTEDADEWPESGLSDAELTALALASDPNQPLDKSAVPISLYFAQLPARLPEWYMPAVMVRGCKRWRIPIVVVVVAAFFIIEAFGLCSTFGQLTLP